MILQLTFLILSLLFPIKAPASPLFGKDQSLKETRSQYLDFLNKFDRQFCTSKTKSTFQQLSKKRKELDVYVPELPNGEPDVETIRENLNEVSKKWDWLIQVRSRLKQDKQLPSRKQISNLEKQIEELLELKKKHFLLGNNSNDLKKQSQKQLQHFQKSFEATMEKFYFLKGFDYPVDHLKQRQSYENLKGKNNKKANEVMFVRQLQEDGTYDPESHKNQDVYLRTTLNSISVNFKKEDTWLSETLRHDLEWALRDIKSQLRWGKDRQLGRIQAWINRMSKVKRFYSNLLKPQNGNQERQKFREKREAGLKLKNFVYSINAQVYKALQKESELTQALYVFDQILLHEVGQASNDNWRDRKDVAQVIINSKNNSALSTIFFNENYFDYFIKEGVPKEALNQSSWLNVLFKELRFSFTLYYIPAVQHIFCPDFYKIAKTTRNKNIYLAIQQLKNPNNDFKALRYFSRWSMIGRVDMSEVWDGFKIIPERVGAKYKNQSQLKKSFQNGRYQYFYSFKDPKRTQYHVISIKKKKYAIKGPLKNPTFYAYRDPHRFRFFEPK